VPHHGVIVFRFKNTYTEIGPRAARWTKTISRA
jgi:hypothetical protein